MNVAGGVYYSSLQGPSPIPTPVARSGVNPSKYMAWSCGETVSQRKPSYSYQKQKSSSGRNFSYSLQWLKDLFYLQDLMVLFSHLVVSDSLQPHGLQHPRLSCPWPSPGACSYACLLSQWCHPTISSSVVPFSSCLQYFPATGSFLMSWLFSSRGQSIGASVSVLPVTSWD